MIDVKFKTFSSRIFLSKSIFIISLVFLIFLYIQNNYDNDISHISSDVWLYNFSHVQKEEGVWTSVPRNYTDEPYYLAYPILNWAASSWDSGVLRFHFLAISLLVATYVINGLVIYAVTKKWWVATLVGILLVIPHNVFSTQIGMINFNNVRGLGFAFPLYYLLSYYWIIFGINNRTANILLALIAGALVYLYPLVGVIIIPFFVLTAFIVKGKKYWKTISVFIGVYLMVSSLFWYGHLTSGHTGMLDQMVTLSSEQSTTQIEILKERFHGSLFDIEFGKIKRSIWDGLPLVIIFGLSFWMFRFKNKIIETPINQFTKISFIFTIITLTFVVSVETINQFLIHYNRPAFFIEHIRLLRALGFIMVGQSVIGLYVLSEYFQRRRLVAVIALFLIVTPLWLSAPVVRSIVRFSIPISVREKYNLAPIVKPGVNNSFSNLQVSALWVKENSPKSSQVFVFDDYQREFIFKVLSKRDTNMTVKEGSVWVTSGFDNSVRWYEERMQYKKIVENATNFSDILDFAKSLKMTHMLIPRGKYEDLFISSGLDLKTVYQNYDYRLIVI